MTPLLASALVASVLPGPARAESAIRFTEVTRAAGIRFLNMYGGVRTKELILETTGTGAAFFDYDGDGDQDLFLANGSRLGYDESQSLSAALFRNDGAGRFAEVTGPAGLESYGWGQGVATVDHENDGDLDLLVTRYGRNLFFRNRGDGTFEEVAARFGLDDPQWGAGAAFGDLDQDGAADLVVVNYVDFDPAATPGPGEAPNCFFLGIPVMCGPKGLDPAPALLYRAGPDGRFVRVEDSAIGRERFFGLGVVLGDLDDDGDLDIYVANDQTPNNFYRNDSDGAGLALTEIGLGAGVAYNEDGRAQAGMGVDLGDYDGDGRLDIVVTNFSHDYNTLYRAAGEGWFLDESFAAGVAEPSYPFLGWGVGFRDLDLDGWLDLIVVNGHVYPEVAGSGAESDYAQRGLVFRNRGTGAFAEVAPTALAAARVYRGAAFADYDDDGDPDLLATVMNDEPALFRNDTRTGAWAGFRLVGRGSPRDGGGARISLRSGESLQVRESRSGGSYLSASDLRVRFGLGDHEGPIRARLRWLSGCEQEVEAAPGRYPPRRGTGLRGPPPRAAGSDAIRTRRPRPAPPGTARSRGRLTPVAADDRSASRPARGGERSSRRGSDACRSWRPRARRGATILAAVAAVPAWPPPRAEGNDSPTTAPATRSTAAPARGGERPVRAGRRTPPSTGRTPRVPGRSRAPRPRPG